MTGSSILPRLGALARGPVASGSILSLLVRVAGLGLGFVQAVLTGRLLGPEGYGQVALVFSLSMVLATLSMGGASVLSVREVSRLDALERHGELRGFLTLTLAVVTGTTLGAVGLYLLLAPRLSPVGELTPYVALLAPLLGLILLGQAVVSGFGRVFMAQAPMQLLRPLMLVTVLAAVWLGGLPFGPRAYLSATVALAAVAALAVALAVLRRLSGLRGVAPVPFPPGDWLRDAAPFYLSGLAGLVLGELGTLMLGWWAGPQETGLFQPVARISMLLTLGLHTIAVRFAPRVAELHAQRQHGRIEEISAKATIAATAVAVAGALGLLAFAPFMLGLFGKAFLQAGPALWWVVAGQIFNCATGLVFPLLNMSGHGRSTLPPQLLGVAVTLLLGALFIPGQGASGAAIAMAGGLFATNLAMLLLVRRYLGFSPDLLSALRYLRRSGW